MKQVKRDKSTRKRGDVLLATTLPRPERDAFKEIAERHERSASYVLRKIIREYLAEDEAEIRGTSAAADLG